MRTLWILPFLLTTALAEVTIPTDWMVISPVDRRGRRPFNPDAVFRDYIVAKGKHPKPGDVVDGTRGERPWRWLKTNDKGRVGGRFSWAYTIVKSDRDQVVLGALAGGALLVVNGELYVGDIYRYGIDGVPVRLKKGANHVYVRGVRGGFQLTMREVEPGAHLLLRDATLPDMIAGKMTVAEGSVVVANTSETMVHNVPPMGVRRLPVTVRYDGAPVAENAKGRIEVDLSPSMGLTGRFKIVVRESTAAHKVTFRSRIDGSVQYFGVLAPKRATQDSGIVLTLHGAGVQARRQAACYAPKSDLWIIAPTNRRPFGFDWQDWGRVDAYEVLAAAQKRYTTMPGRVYLTGHSMGGHGSWHLGANDPDLWLGIAPCAGWESFDTYGRGARKGALDALWRGADLAGDTKRFVSNLAESNVFVLHGEDDKTVPVAEARRMEAAVRSAGGSPRSHYEPGKGHWYDGKVSAGTDCVDWPGIFEMFGEFKTPLGAPRAAPAKFSFVSADPGVDATHFWLDLRQPLEYGTEMRVDVEGDRITTSNVRRLHLTRSGDVAVDGVKFVAPVELLRDADTWVKAEQSLAGEKSPERSGPFKRAFDRRFVLVHGAADRLGASRARLDAQRWWYIGNGDCAVLTDEQFAMGDYSGRNVILYGNSETNRAWASVVPENCPIVLRQGEAVVNGESHKARDLGCVFVYPRRGEKAALVGVVGWTGRAGALTSATIPLFVAGVGIPDYVLFSSKTLTEGDLGVRTAGWFDHRWRLPSSQPNSPR